jgi:phosphoglycerate dehydrogenase-like enzyme
MRSTASRHRFEPDLEKLAADSDFLVISIAGGPQSRGVVGEAVLNALGPEGILINVARGSIVDEDALVRALADGRLGGAGLDLFAHEPNVPEALCSIDRVVLQSHRATRRGLRRERAANARRMSAGRRARNRQEPLHERGILRTRLGCCRLGGVAERLRFYRTYDRPGGARPGSRPTASARPHFGAARGTAY